MENHLPFSEMPPEEGLWDTEGILSPFQSSFNEKIIAILGKINLKTDDILYDLGCGNGVVLVHAAFVGCKKAVGIELNQDLINEAKKEISDLGLEETIHIISESFLNTDLSEATVIYIYLIPEAIAKLREKLIGCFGLNTRVIVSLHFPIPWWTPQEEFLNYYIYYPQ